MFCLNCHTNAFANVGSKKIIHRSMFLVDKNWPKIILDDIEKMDQNFDMCTSCDNKIDEELLKFEDFETLQFYTTSLFLLKKLYIKSIKASIFFNFITNEEIIHHTKYLVRENRNFSLYLNDFLKRTYKYDHKIFSAYWKGANYYYYKIFDFYLQEPFPKEYFNLNLITDLPLL